MINKGDYIESCGSHIYFELTGNPNAKPLLMLHGGLGSTRDLVTLHPYLVEDYCLISVDFRGHGKSILEGPALSYAQYQQDVLDVLSHLGVTRYSIFGFSDGGIVGYRLAAQQTEHVVSLITLGSQWRLETDDPSIDILSGLTAEYWNENCPEDLRTYNASNPSPDFSRLLKAVKSVWLDTTDLGYPKNLVKQISCPTLIMRGDNDFLFSLDEAAALKASIQNVDFANIPFTSHAAHQESPQLVGTIVSEFLSQSNLE
ncbi:alpha/beta fold hydrolase [Pseudoalteromonas luteoviolacea]|uniref:AB hydrolase-1 domain-containing protein n=1 Tax=Pseudoalteromonas luteoviolacea DSM 6061 TaxID=1365250 RepID=A0A166WSQ7_9GAMM|nr:alpha/beta hydrolase [Pseudoalteromonas luteoviolacea]KZN38034.1 hypothetical protein N475_15515 [Pseudoalteromonas luteoviolacea DSM 6061]MBE0388950.1 hypothetical protein [Pseudoalteromonas luteoviolacea DSM 6061]